MQRCAIRVDASRQMGSGHVMRCATLAHALRKSDVDVTFVCREHEGNYCDWLERSGFKVFRLPLPSSIELKDHRLAHADWLGATQARDSEETRERLSPMSLDWLIVDHYGLDAEWESHMRPIATRIMAIDDLADRPHDVDVLLDQGIQQFEDRYSGLVADTSIKLLGPQFCLLRSEFAELRAGMAARDGKLKRLLIFMGGSDPHNLTSMALEAIRQSGLTVQVDVAVGAASDHVAAVKMACERAPNCNLHVQTADMARLMAEADLMIGAPGMATWERCCLSLPSILIAFADNQMGMGEHIARRRAAIFLGDRRSVRADELAQMLARLNTKPRLLRQMGSRAGSIVDGRGSDRVCAVLGLSETSELKARAAQLSDEGLFFRWANDPLVRRNAFSPDRIEADGHRNWFRKRVGDRSNYRLYVVENRDGVAIGQVRFEKGDEGWTIDYSLDSAFRGRGVGSLLLETATKALKKDKGQVLVIGKVKAQNIASRRVFEKLLYQVDASERAGTVFEFVFRRSL